jgi:hypothetical protein
MGSVAMDASGDMALGYSIAGSSKFPSVRWTGRLAGDPVGTLTQGENEVATGAGSQTAYGRWGDYSSMSVDPTDDCTFWYTQEYYASTSRAGWQTRIASFQLSGCAAPQATAPSAPQNLSATAGNQSVTLSWSPPSSDGGSPVTGYNVFRGTFADGELTAPVATNVQSPYTDAGLTNGQTYYYRVAAVNGAGQGPMSNEASAAPVAPPANSPPTATFTKSCTGRTCTFNGSASSDPNGDALTYGWTFGDGGSGAGAQVTHTYPRQGGHTYTVRLTVTDTHGATGSTTTSVVCKKAAGGASCT